MNDEKKSSLKDYIPYILIISALGGSYFLWWLILAVIPLLYIISRSPKIFNFVGENIYTDNPIQENSLEISEQDFVYGELTWPNGDTYIGEHINNIPNGKGTATYSDGEVIAADGYFIEGFPEGEGQLTYSDGSIYEGELLSGTPHGQGKVIYPDGSIYEGELLSGTPHGQGKVIYPDGSTDQGEFAPMSVLHGKGIRKKSDGSVYEGEFEIDLPNGKGKITNPDGTEEEGVFKNGILVK